VKQVAFPSSHWASNIGNPFFTLGTKYLVESVAPQITVHLTDWIPHRAFKLNKRERASDLRYGRYVEGVDGVILTGPMFNCKFQELFEPTFRQANENGTKIILISTGGIDYSDEEIDHCRTVLKKYRPYILTTRDRDTFDNYSDLAEHAYDGICTAWFVADYYPGYPTPALEPYITLTFDANPEPHIELGAFGGGDSTTFSQVRIESVPHGTRGKIMRLLQRNFDKRLGEFNILRPCHGVLNKANWRLFFKPNSFVSQTPFGYLNIYRNSNLTVTDRLHACVATLAYGNPARLLIRSKRARLLDRMGVADAMEKIVRVDMDRLNHEKKAVSEWLREALVEFS
jgi:hypothetical protein